MMKIEKKDTESTPLSLFWTFFKIGAFTFGGGWAMISIIEREIVTKHRWLDKDEFLDLLAVAQSMPGILAVNIAVTVGDKLLGGKGSVSAAAGTILPSFMIILFIAIFLSPEDITENEALTRIFKGIRPVVVALIVAPVITTYRRSGLSWKMMWIPAVVALTVWSKIPFISNPIFWIVLAGVVGWYLTRRATIINNHNKTEQR